MGLTDQPSNSVSCHGAERSPWYCAAPAERAGEGAAAQGKLPDRSNSHSSSLAMLPNTQSHHSSTRGRAILLQVPEMRPCPRWDVSARDLSCQRESPKKHPQHPHISHHCESKRGKRRVVVSQGDMKSKRKKKLMLEFYCNSCQ